MFNKSNLTTAQWSVVNEVIAQYGLTVEQELTVCQLLEYRARDPWEFNEYEAAHIFCAEVQRVNPTAPNYVPFYDSYLQYTEPFWSGMPCRNVIFRTHNGFMYISPTTSSISSYDFFVMDDYGNLVGTTVSAANLYKLQEH